MQNKDIYINTAGGIKINEPAIDLGIAIAMVSSMKSLVIPLDTVVFGELGLTGEVRAVGLCERRLKEAHYIGYKRGIIPLENAKQITADFNDFKIDPIQNIGDIIYFLKK